ncbi:DUF2895 family protein [Legionella pneumophila]|uniref:DUF2895 family protein n=1 Tax=Legionella pneumophila TaxID=446 RepID=UPI00048E1724|nr:DUF2895 family protein [Legionella pneumophila]RYB34896.1 DUF2895 family protein [Legionella pneumophila]RYW28580.1 DUF2895 family protein [Legionella pneumophila]HAT1867301.1 DUF2895 family protein [Legionella pneumophila]HAT1907428.1 DUF2895 family protein [Legionella pneumophila]HAT1916887.1 DUF2895 family protein [Legionella pneumophila]
MFHYWKKVDSLNHINRLLLAFVTVLILIVVGLIITLTNMPKRFEFWLTPAMSANGGLIKENQISREYVQGFVATLLPTLNTWSNGGKTEFANNLSGFHYYFTPRHQALMDKTLNAYKDAQLFNRVQVASLYRFMEDDDVKPLGNNTWEVHMVLRITQRLKDDSPMVIADKVVDYHVRVVKISLSRLQNPFQLALDGYTQPEILVKDLLATDSGGTQHENR